MARIIDEQALVQVERLLVSPRVLPFQRSREEGVVLPQITAS